MNRRHLMACAVALIISAAALPTSAAAATEADLITASPEPIAVPVPAPGHSAEALMYVRAATVKEVALGLRVIAVHDDPLSAEGSPLTVQLEFDGEPLGDGRSLNRLTQDDIALGRLTDQAQHQLRAVVSMDRSAGNQYEGLSTSAVMRFVAQAADPTTSPANPANPERPGGELAFTGPGIPIAIALVASAALFAVGVLLRRRRTADILEEEK